MSARRFDPHRAVLEDEVRRCVRLCAILAQAAAGPDGDPLAVLVAAERLDELEQTGSWWTPQRVRVLLAETKAAA